MQSQITALEQANEAIHTCRKRKRKAITLGNASSGNEVQAMVAVVNENHVEAN